MQLYLVKSYWHTIASALFWYYRGAKVLWPNIIAISGTVKPWANQEALLRENFSSCQCFPVCPPLGYIVAETKFASAEEKCFPINSETFLSRKNVFQFTHMFPAKQACGTTWRKQIRRKNDDTSCPKCFHMQQCFLVCPGLNSNKWHLVQ